MFWKYNNNSSCQIEALLGKEDVTLQEVMDEDDIINECRVQNKLLIDFLSKPEVMEELVVLTTKEPSADLDERIRFKYSNVACELLTCDVPALNERLAGDKILLDRLYNFLDCEPPLNPLLASFFSKIMGALIAWKDEQNWLSYQMTCLQVLDFLKAKDTFISLLLKHLGTSAIMDLMLKLFTQVEGTDIKQNILNWLNSQQIMQTLVSLFDPKVDRERHFNVAQLLCDFIRIARDKQSNSSKADPDTLLNSLESSDTVSLLLGHILGEEKSESGIVGGIQVLLALLDVHQTSIPKYNTVNNYNDNIGDEANDMEQKQRVLNNISHTIMTRIEDFHHLLLEPPKRAPMLTTVGLLDPPVGNTRLQVLKLYASAILSNNSDLMQKIISIGSFPVILDLFFKYPWNNFLHTQVERCLVLALKTYVSEDSDDTAIALCKHLLENCKLIDRILDAWRDNDTQQKESNGVRQGYMGHLISIVNEIDELISSTYLGQYLKENLPETSKTFEEFKESTLNEINSVQQSLLGGALPNMPNDDELEELPSPHDSALQQQMYSEYQVQHLTSQFIDGYSGFNDDAFNDGDDTVQSTDHRTDMNFGLSENDLAIQQEIFKQVCAQSINTLDDADDQIFEEREHTFQTVIEKHGDHNEGYSSDSDDDSPESPAEDNIMEVDPWSSPKNSEGSGDKISADPWDTLEHNSSDANVGGWADFGNVNFMANFSKAFENKKLLSGKVDDLKVENIEMGDDSVKSNIKDEDTGLNVTDATSSPDNSPKKDILSIISVAQEKKDFASIPNKEIAAGDQIEIPISTDLILNEPSKITTLEVEGENSSPEITENRTISEPGKSPYISM